MNSLLPFQNNGLANPLLPYDFEFPPPLRNDIPDRQNTAKKPAVKEKTTSKSHQKKNDLKRRRLAT